MEELVEKGRLAVLLGEDGEKLLITADMGARRVRGMGVLDTGALVGSRLGTVVSIGNRRFIIMRPSIIDRIDTLTRKAQIVMPKDSAHILMQCDIISGKRVAEAGSGTGALTAAIANAVLPDGRVYSYDIRLEFLKAAQENVISAGLDCACEFKTGDVCAPGGIREKDLDAVVLDIPEPWRALDNAWAALRPCGHLACYSPTVNQVEQTVRALFDQKFVGVRTVETLQREMLVVEKGIRPSFEMLGHSGYLTFARKVLERF
jgi:tRNA (adenine57-N1/adenine58-N1)-methyltransferase